MEAYLLAVALEELALHAFPGIGFQRLCFLLQQEHQLHLDPFVKDVLWRSLYRCPDAVFAAASPSACDTDSTAEGASAGEEAAEGAPGERGGGAACLTGGPPRLSWRNPAIPPSLLAPAPSAAASLEAGGPSSPGSERAAASGQHQEASPAAAAEDCWLLSASAGVAVRLLTTGDFACCCPADFERRAAEVPFKLLRSVARHKEHGQWQYRIAQELELEPKSVFHHLKPLYREELILHMQLAIPPGHKGPSQQQSATEALRAGAPSASPGLLLPRAERKAGAAAAAAAGGRGGGGGPRANLTMSALLWSSKFFSAHRLPAAVRGLATLHHLLPLQQQALELLQGAPNGILLENEAPYLRFSDKQIRRLFHRVREALERSGRIRRVRAFCRQTVRYERCLLLCRPEEALKGERKKEQTPHADGPHTGSNTADTTTLTQVKVEEGMLAAAAARTEQLGGAGLQAGGRDNQAAAEAGDEGDDGPSVVLEAEGIPLSALASLLLKAAGAEGLTTVQFSQLLGLDSKRSGKILTDFHRRRLVTRVAERRGKCFLYRYVSADLPHLQGFLREAAEGPGALEPTAGGDHLLPDAGAQPAAETPPAAAAVPVAAVASAAAVACNVADFAAAEGEELQAEQEAPASSSRGRRPSRRGRRGRGASAASTTAAAAADTRKRRAAGGAARGASSRGKRQRIAGPLSSNEPQALVKVEQPEPPVAADPEAAAAAATADAAEAEVALPPAADADGAAVAASSSNGLAEAADRKQQDDASAKGGGPRPRSASTVERLKAKAAQQKLPARTLRLLHTPQFAARLAVFQDAIEAAGCSTIPTISRAIADLEQTANGPDRKTVQRMAEVAMQLEPRIRRGRLAASRAAAAAAAERGEEPAGSAAAAAAGEITFFYWAEQHDEASAEQRIAALITQRRAQGCREAIRRNQLLLDGKLKEAGEELRLSASSASSAAPPFPEPRTIPAAAGEASGAPPLGPLAAADGEGAPLGNAAAESPAKDELVDQQLRGLEGEISRLVSLESRSGSASVGQPSPPATAASLLVVEKTLPQASPQDKVSFSQKHLSFYGFIFPVMIRAKCFHQYLLSLSLQLKAATAASGSPAGHDWRRLAVSTMVKRMPLESFLRLVGCGYALPLLDEHLAREAASQQPMASLPGVLFRLLVFSSRQLQCYRQLHPAAKLPLLGLGKKHAGTAIRKLLSLLARMGIVSRMAGESPKPHEGGTSEKSPPQSAVFWTLNERLLLPPFSAGSLKADRTEAGESPDAAGAKEFDGFSHEGVEAFWQQLQLQVSQWMLQAQRLSWEAELSAQPSAFFSPHSDAADEEEGLQQQASDQEAPHGEPGHEAPASQPRKRPRPPPGFNVPEAFNAKSWKGQVAFSGAARAAMDAFAAETLERLRDAGGSELKAVVLNASSPQIAALAARIGCPTDAVLRYLIRVFEIRGGRECNQALLVGGPFVEGEEQAAGEEDGGALLSPAAAPPTDLQEAPCPAAEGFHASQQASSGGPPGQTPGAAAAAATKTEAKERDRGVGLIVHRTREVRFQCHHCGHFYSWEKSIRLHYEKIHRETLPADEALYVLPWERKRRQEDKQQQAELSKFRKRRRPFFPPRDADAAVSSSQRGAEDRAGERFTGRLPTRGTVKAVEAPAKGFLLRATRDEEAVLASMSREDEIILMGAAIVAERLWQAAQKARGGPSVASLGDGEKASGSLGPLTDAWLSPGAAPQSFPSEDHLIWQARSFAAILGWLCRPPLPPASARLYVGFVLSRRALNSRIYNSFRRLQPSALRRCVLEGRIPSALELRMQSLSRQEGCGPPRKSLICRPLTSPRIVMARNMLKAVVLTPLPFYRPAVLFAALRELRPLELSALWRAWQRRGWITAFKPAAAAAPVRREATAAEPRARQQQQFKRPEIAGALESKCRRPFVLSSGARLSLFGRLRDYRSLSALLEASSSVAARSQALSAQADTASTSPLREAQEAGERQQAELAPSRNGRQPPASDAAHELLLSNLGQEANDPSSGPAGEVELIADADLALLRLLEGDSLDQTADSGHTASAAVQGSACSPAEGSSSRRVSAEIAASEPASGALAVQGRVRLPVDAQLSGFEVLAALEGLARGRLWLAPFWGRDGRLPDSPEAADDAALLNLLEEEDALDSRAREAESLWAEVPEWLSAISLGRGEETAELLAGRGLRKPTEGGIETHITAHAAGVAEVTAVTCAALGRPVAPARQLPAADGTPAAHAPAPGAAAPPDGKAEDADDRLCADVGGFCRELRAAFACEGHAASPPLGLDSDAAGNRQEKAARRSRGVFVAPAAHLADGLFGAAGELDAFDPSLLPPVLTDRAASAAVTLAAEHEEVSGHSGGPAGDLRAAAVRPGLLCGFPVSLPTYADDHKQHWRLATKAAEAFAPRACSCTAACSSSGSHRKEAAADAAAAGTTPSIEHEKPCSPVRPCSMFARRGPGSEDSERGQREAQEGGSAEQSPLEVLRLRLTASRTCQSSAAHACSSSAAAAEDAWSMPDGLLAAVANVARVALRVQRGFLLPLLPTPPSPLAATLLEEAISGELRLLPLTRSPSTAAAAEALASNQKSVESSWTVCTALTLCTAWILAAVLNAKAEGVGVPELLIRLCNVGEAAAAGGPLPSCLHDAARLALESVASQLVSFFCMQGRQGEVLGGKVTSGEGLPAATASAQSGGSQSGLLKHESMDTLSAALPCQLFLVGASVLCWLRLAVPLPGGSSWRLVAAAEAAGRFCLRARGVLHDLVGERWGFHQCAFEDDCTEAANAPAFAADSPARHADGCTAESRLTALPPPPAMVPRAIWAGWGPGGGASSRRQRGAHTQQPLASSPVGQREESGDCLRSAERRCSCCSQADSDQEEADLQAVSVSRFLSALMTWTDSAPDSLSSSAEADPGDRGEAAHSASASPQAAFSRTHLLPMKLSSDLLPACAWLRLDGHLHASLVQLLCLRLWGLLVQRPGSTAQQLQGMLCLLDDCEVQLLLHALAEEGVVTAVVLSKLPAEEDSSDGGLSPPAGSHFSPGPTAAEPLSSELGQARTGEPLGNLQERSGEAGADELRPPKQEPLGSRPTEFASSVTDYTLRFQTIYLPNAVADVLPKFQPFLLPKAAACGCGCSVLL
ncbi:hypothetical protein Efla_006261 [Eimeria flavescens]